MGSIIYCSERAGETPPYSGKLEVHDMRDKKKCERRPLYIVYRCSDCNHLNLIRMDVEEPRIGRIIDEYKNGVFRAAEFNFPCEKCGYKEAWSMMRYSEIEKHFPLPFMVAGILAVLCFWKKAFFVSAVFPIGVGMWFLIKHFHRSHMEKCIAQLPKQSLPILTTNKNELIYLMKQQQYDESQDEYHAEPSE